VFRGRRDGASNFQKRVPSSRTGTDRQRRQRQLLPSPPTADLQCLLLPERSVRRNRRLQPKSAFSPFSPVHWADLEGPLRVESSRCQPPRERPLIALSSPPQLRGYAPVRSSLSSPSWSSGCVRSANSAFSTALATLRTSVLSAAASSGVISPVAACDLRAHPDPSRRYLTLRQIPSRAQGRIA